MKQTIFVVEDDADISRLVRYHLETSEFSVKVFPSGAGVIRQAEADPPSLFLLDIMIPGGSGLDLCREIRSRSSTVPILVLSSASDEFDKVLLLELGADDYVTKPFSPRELLARVRAALRRLSQVTLPSDVISFDDVVVN